MKVLVGCEFTGAVRDAFREKGHDAWSCDIIDDEHGSKYHIKEDLLKVIPREKWDMGIFFPPCTHLCVSGARWFPNKVKEQAESLDFVRKLMGCKIPRIAIENPKGVISTKIRKPTQIIQPWQFGHGEQKETHLWLKNLKKLTPTDIVEGREQTVLKHPPSEHRGMDRSRTYLGIAEAMAAQWGTALPEIQTQMEAFQTA